MKKKVISLLLCLTLLVGVLPAGTLSLTASAVETDLADSGVVGKIEITNCYFNSNQQLIVEWKGVAGATDYTVDLWQYHVDSTDRETIDYNYITVKDESENESTFTTTFFRGVFFERREAGVMDTEFAVTIVAKNNYNETIAEGASSGIYADFIQYIEPVQNCYLSKTGIFCFDHVPHASTYRIDCFFNGKRMASVQSSIPNLDCSSFVREGDKYNFDITVYSNSSKYIDTINYIHDIEYSSDTPLAGHAYVNDDYTVTYRHFLKYLEENSPSVLHHSWLAFNGTQWIPVAWSRAKDYDPNFLRVTVTADGFDGSVTSPDQTYTDSSRHYYAYNADGLRTVFNADRGTIGNTAYIKLSADITINNTDSSDDYILTANGGNVDIDLCGHTINYTRSFSGWYYGAFIYGKTGTVTIRDSRRYDTDKGEWVDGRINYNYTGSNNTCTVLYGNITINGGVIENKRHWNSTGGYYYCFYGTGEFRMYGGTLTADRPMSLWNQRRGTAPYGVFGGTLNICRDHAIRANASHTGSVAPVFKNLTINNLSGNQTVDAIRYDTAYTTSTRQEREEKWDELFLTGTDAYIDGIKQTSLKDGVDLDTNQYITGPSFKGTYELVLPTQISEVTITIPEAQPFAEASYIASAPDGAGYMVGSNYTYSVWRKGVYYKEVDAGEKSPGFSFLPGERYWASVLIRLSDFKAYSFASSVTATVNGETALFYHYGGDYYRVDFYFVVPKAQVNNIEITAQKPRAGQPVRYIANLPDGAGYQLMDYNDGNWRNGVVWLCDDTEINPASGTKFKAGKWYTVVFDIEISDENKYYFADEDVLTATVNGQKAGRIHKMTDTQYSILFNCYCPYPRVDQLDVTVTEPKASELITYDSEVPYDMGYEVPEYNNGTSYESGVMWTKNGEVLSPQDDHYFEVGQQYTVYVLVDIADEYYFEFDEPMNMSFYINDKRAIDYQISDTRYRLSYTFTVPDDTPAEIHILGDADGNGKVDIFDASSIQKSLAGASGYPKYSEMSKTDISFKVADVDGNGTVDIFDASLIQKFLAGSDAAKAYPIGKPI